VVGRPQRIGLARPHLDVVTHGRLPCSVVLGGAGVVQASGRCPHPRCRVAAP
jgi:hypothetical protein